MYPLVPPRERLDELMPSVAAQDSTRRRIPPVEQSQEERGCESPRRFIPRPRGNAEHESGADR
jgi:hypothetical protein